MKSCFVLCLMGLMHAVIAEDINHQPIAEPKKLSLKLSSLENVYTTAFKSAANNHSYHIFIRLPNDTETGKTYPVVYLLDGDITFPLLSAYQRYLELSEEIPKAILVLSLIPI